MSRAHAGRGLRSFGVICAPPSPFWASVRKGLANAAITGQRAKGFLSLLRIRRSRVLRVFWIRGEKSMGKGPSLGLAGGCLGLLYRKDG